MVDLVLLAALSLAGAASDEATIIIVVGAEGTPEFGRKFDTWAARWADAGRRSGAKVVRIGTPAAAAASGESADRARLQEALEHEPKEGPAPLWLVLIGHGTFDGEQAKFNLHGRDVAAAELAKWLAPFTRALAVVDCTSSSGPFVNRLSAENRVIVTATKSGYEQNFARFGEHISAAVLNPEADLDKDGQTSLLEAFLLASRRVAEFYSQQARLATEFALIDDNGDGLGTPAEWFVGVRADRRAQDDASLDGTRAHQLHLIRSEREREMPAEIRAQRDTLELAVASLREKKPQFDADAYYAQLEPLLLKLARLYEKYDRSRPE